jgi:translocation and assembly module TamB
MKKFYRLLVFLVEFAIVAALLVVYLASRPETLAYIGEEFLKPRGIDYRALEGTLYEGFTLYDVNVSEEISIKKLAVSYTFRKLFLPVPRLDEVSVEGLHITPFATEDEGTEGLSLPSFAIRSLRATDLLIRSEVPVRIDIAAHNSVLKTNRLDAEQISVLAVTKFETARIEGRIEQSVFRGKGRLTPEPVALKPYLDYFKEPPATLEVEIESASLESATLRTRVDRLRYAEDEALSMEAIDLGLNYVYATGRFGFDATYGVRYGQNHALVEQQGMFTTEGVYATSFDAEVTQHSVGLPSETLKGELSGDLETMDARLETGGIVMKGSTRGYETFSLSAHSGALAIGFIDGLPDLLQQTVARVDANATFTRLPEPLVCGGFALDADHTAIGGSFEYAQRHAYVDAVVDPDVSSKLWQELPLRPRAPVHTFFYHAPEESMLYVDSQELSATLFRHRNAVEGWGSFYEVLFDVNGTVAEDGDTDLHIDSKIPSLYSLINELRPIEIDEYEYYDAEVHVSSRLSVTDEVRIESRVKIPWYALVFDSQHRYYGSESEIVAAVDDSRVTVEQYRLDIMGHSVHSKKPSVIAFDANGTVDIREFWIFDALRLSGRASLSEEEASLRLSSERFDYEGPEGRVSLKTDLRFAMEGNATQSLEGSITLLEGEITYLPVREFTVHDDDIIIVQDVRPPSKSKLFVNVALRSAKPIAYKTKEVDIAFSPDVTLWKEPASPLQLLGMVSVHDGWLYSGGKEFEVRPSEIYFGGAHPINPYLNLHLQYEVDYKYIGIYVTHTLSDPVFLFTSEPPMSQNDIMSYILFGTPASSSFDGAEGGSASVSAANLILGTGLKNMIGGATGVRIDTMNILTPQDGSFGFEVGARLNKQLRVLYKNDTISSIILQYSVTRAVRLDIDVRETGQGVNVIFIKDFPEWWKKRERE